MYFRAKVTARKKKRKIREFVGAENVLLLLQNQDIGLWINADFDFSFSSNAAVSLSDK